MLNEVAEISKPCHICTRIYIYTAQPYYLIPYNVKQTTKLVNKNACM